MFATADGPEGALATTATAVGTAFAGRAGHGALDGLGHLDASRSSGLQLDPEVAPDSN